MLFPTTRFILFFWPPSPLFWTFLYRILPLLRPSDATSRCWCNWEFLVLSASCDDLSEAEISSSKQFSSRRPIELLLDLGALRNLSSIGPGRDFGSELSIKSFRVSLYLWEITTISKFLSFSLTAYLTTCFLRIITILFWRERGVLAQVFLK